MRGGRNGGVPTCERGCCVKGGGSALAIAGWRTGPQKMAPHRLKHLAAQPAFAWQSFPISFIDVWSIAMPSSWSQHAGVDITVGFALVTGVEATAMPPAMGSRATETATQMTTIVRAIAMANLRTWKLCRPAVQGQVTAS